jgi:D-alanyl-D-alanine carboxypeptidase
MKKLKLIVIILAILLIGGGLVYWVYNRNHSSGTSKFTDVTDGFNKNAHSLTNPSSIWVVANKQRPLDPKTYAPSLTVPQIPLRSNITSDERQVAKVMATPLESMVNDAKNDNIAFDLESGYRSYDFQVALYNRYVQQQGKAVADSQSARPGFSEHQTGLAADLGGKSKPACNVEACYGDTPEGKWLVANAYKYGFIIRYPSDKAGVTGYIYEPWHIRYVGTYLATEMHNQHVETLEEFFGLGSAPDYK